jgi:hypothetical protein
MRGTIHNQPLGDFAAQDFMTKKRKPFNSTVLGIHRWSGAANGP